MEILSEPTSNKLRVMRTASAAARPYQGDSLALYLIADELGSLRVNDGNSEAISGKEKEEISWKYGKVRGEWWKWGVAMKCNVSDKLVKFNGKDNDLVILNKLVQEVGRNMDMQNGSGNREDNNTYIYKYCDNEIRKCNEAKSSIISKIIENGDPKAMGNGINISIFVRTKVESNHCESYETSSSKVKKAFSHLIGKQNELTQELASQGLSILYELGHDCVKKNLVNALVGTFTGSKKRKRAVKLVNDTEVFQEGSIRETLSRVKLGTYKELCNLENDMGQPDLIYKSLEVLGSVNRLQVVVRKELNPCCETAQEIWLRVQQMMKGSNIGIQEKKAKLFNEWERFTSNEGESIESYY
nr:proteasome-associated protein ECM29 homolog [Tanacetum cinerariifolium]